MNYSYKTVAIFAYEWSLFYILFIYFIYLFICLFICLLKKNIPLNYSCTISDF